MPSGLVLECPVCGAQRPFDIDIENPPKLLEPRLKMSSEEHLKQAHDQDEMTVSQWNEIVDTMFEADVPQSILNEIEADTRDPKWRDYGLQ